VRAWLFRVAVNCSHDIHRQRSRRPADPLEDSEGRVLDLPDPGLGPEATVLQRERADAIRIALLALPHDFRVAVVLRERQPALLRGDGAGSERSRWER